jgi:hypothetical protein
VPSEVHNRFDTERFARLGVGVRAEAVPELLDVLDLGVFPVVLDVGDDPAIYPCKSGLSVGVGGTVGPTVPRIHALSAATLVDAATGRPGRSLPAPGRTCRRGGASVDGDTPAAGFIGAGASTATASDSCRKRTRLAPKARGVPVHGKRMRICSSISPSWTARSTNSRPSLRSSR